MLNSTSNFPGSVLTGGSGDDTLIRDFLVADVFTDTPLEGNQLGIFPDGRGLSGELMQQAGMVRLVGVVDTDTARAV